MCKQFYRSSSYETKQRNTTSSIKQSSSVSNLLQKNNNSNLFKTSKEASVSHEDGLHTFNNSSRTSDLKKSYLQDLEKQIADQKQRKEREKLEKKVDWWELRQAGKNDSTDEKREDDPRPDPWETKRKYEEDLRKQMEFKRKQEEEKRMRDKAEEVKLEKRIREQQERMKREYEQELIRRREKEEKRRNSEEKKEGNDDEEQKTKDSSIPLSPPVPALRERSKDKTQEERDLIGNITFCFNFIIFFIQINSGACADLLIKEEKN